MEEQGRFAYDAFISYSHADRDWVTDRLVMHLRENKLRVCIDYETFDAGVSSIRNMENAVAASRRVVLVLTPSWARSEWAGFEALLGQSSDPAGLYQRLVTVLREPCQVQPSIGNLSYIDLTGEQEHPLQLGRLIAGLRGERRLRDAPLVSLGQSSAGTSEPLRNTQETSRLVGEAFMTLSSLMRQPDVHKVAVRHRDDLVTTGSQVVLIGDYKDMHQTLHDLQVHCYNRLARDAARLARDETLWSEIGSEHEPRLRGITGNIVRISQRPAFGVHEQGWIQDYLLPARDALGQALNAADERSLKKSVLLLNRVLTRQLPHYNTLLTNAASDLDLPALLGAMTRVRDSISQSSVDPVLLTRFERGIVALASLHQSLSTAVEDHGRWQVLETELHFIHDNLSRDLQELELACELLQKLTQTLCEDVTDEWADSMRHDLSRLTAAIADDDSTRTRSLFQRFRTIAGQQFYYCDGDLLKLCSDLRALGEPLAAVLEVAT